MSFNICPCSWNTQSSMDAISCIVAFSKGACCSSANVLPRVLQSTMKATKRKRGKSKHVTTPSETSMTSGVRAETMTKSQTYANTANAAVTAKEPKALICRTSSEPTCHMQRAITTRTLKAAPPTIVQGPNCPASMPPPASSMMQSNNSGALAPTAITDKFANESLQSLTDLNCSVSLFSLLILLETICCAAAIKWSEATATPPKHQNKAKQ
mmetsp:Transcript_44630/g.119451  ORF Transcript_44630/g.119451 Transcript_44630/m.119451 type:complete len:212 (+) Transcript_44630:1883-2518(+)